MTIKEWIRKKVLGLLKMSQYEGLPQEEERLTFINDKDQIARARVREYNVWYHGDSDELLNYYTHQNTIEYNYEPWYSRNKRSYFWAISSTESDIKRTHSGQMRNITDTLVSIVGIPEVKAGHSELPATNRVNENLEAILEENNFWDIFRQEQLPMTMVEGWGCYKIAWDKDISDYPIPVYYRAEDVEFIYKMKRITGIIFKDYYTDGKKRYLVTETRYTSHGNLRVEKEIFLIEGAADNSAVKKVDFKDIPAFGDVEDKIEITNYKGLLAVPCIILKDPSGEMHGRSFFAGKIDLFDDLDQLLSQSANTVRRSTPIEYLNTDFLERDKKTGMPKQPKAYDRKYINVKGAKTADGTANTSEPVTVTQPNLDFAKYSTEAIQVLLQIMNGIISPATLGVDIAKKDNAEAQREKEKVTIFTRNMVTSCEQKILKKLFNELLCAKELMDTGVITTKDYTISITFPEFADDSYENKITVLGDQLSKGNISYEMYLSKLYGGKLNDSEYERELKFLKENHQQENENPFGEQGMSDTENETDIEEESGQTPFDMPGVPGQK